MRNRLARRLVLLAALVGVPSARPSAQAAPSDSTRGSIALNSRGFVISAADGFSYFGLRFRLQQWASLSTDDDASGIASTQLAVRRARIRFESVVWDPRLKVNVQLSFSRGDMDFENSGFPNVLRDVTVSWRATPQLTLMAGQGKLPGNRQRVISSGEQQFPDRSIVNASFTLDRDMGMWATYEATEARIPFSLKGAVTSGEGRSVSTGNAGLAYTARLELYPLGAFTGGGDYFEGDLLREPSPRLAVGLVASHNEQAERTGGQLGTFLFAPSDMATVIADALFKYRGLSVSAEYARRTADEPMQVSGADTRTIVTGSGATIQAAYLTKRQFEFGGRLSVVDPHRELGGLVDRQQQASLVVTRYFRAHRVKSQLELTRNDFRDRLTFDSRGGWTLRSSFEVGI